jgi:hypothetical protein
MGAIADHRLGGGSKASDSRPNGIKVRLEQNCIKIREYVFVSVFFTIQIKKINLIIYLNQ